MIVHYVIYEILNTGILLMLIPMAILVAFILAAIAEYLCH